jgi:hypothetical protein
MTWGFGPFNPDDFRETVMSNEYIVFDVVDETPKVVYFDITEGDLLPEIKLAVKKGGVVYGDLTGWTVAFSMARVDDPTSVKVNASAGALDVAGDAKVKYSWQGTDTNTPDLYLAEFKLTDTGAKTLTVPNQDTQKLFVRVNKRVN